MPPFARASSKTLANSAGRRGTITAPSLANGFFTSSARRVALISWLSLPMMGGGVPAGTAMPHPLAAA